MDSKRNLMIAGLIVPAGITLTLFSYIGTYTRFLADDYCSIYDARRLDVLHYIWHWYITWGGRYAAIATDELLAFLGPEGIRIIPAVVVILWLIALVIMFRQLCKAEVFPQVRWTEVVALAFIFLFAIVIVSPQSEGVFYWWNGMRTYVPALIAATLHIAFLYWATEWLQTRRQIILGSVVSFGLALFSSGYNETFTAIQLSFFVGIILLLLSFKQIRFSDNTFRFLLAAILGATLAFTIMLISPGAARRQEFFPPHPEIVTLFRMTAEGYALYLGEIFLNIYKLSALTALFFMAVWVGLQAQEKRTNGLPFLLCIAGGFGLAFASLLPSAYGMSQMPASRTYIVSTYCLLCGFAFGGLALGRWLLHLQWFALAASRSALLWASVAIVVTSAAINTALIYNNRTTYIEFARLWDDAEALVLQARENHEESVTIPAMDNWAYIERPTDNKKYWPNICFSLYYDIQIYGPNYPE